MGMEKRCKKQNDGELIERQANGLYSPFVGWKRDPIKGWMERELSVPTQKHLSSHSAGIRARYSHALLLVAVDEACGQQ